MDVYTRESRSSAIIIDPQQLNQNLESVRGTKLQGPAPEEIHRTVDTQLSVMWKEFLGILALLPLTFTTMNQKGSSCVPSLIIPPNAPSSITEGQALILRCMVRVCAKELPNVIWCRTQGEDGCKAVTSGWGVFYEWEDNMYVLKLVPAHRNDTGHYRCSTEYGRRRITGNVITVNVIGANGRVIRDRSKTWITYFSIALRLWVTVVFYVWIYCFLHQGKGKMELSNKLISCKVKYVPPSKNCNKNNLTETSQRPMDGDPPTESFDIICEDWGTRD